ncbi:MAG TPA: DNA integrity scanning diadenylate cyclase DisA [Symbiobacteriaceae bacterium]|jgi:diadenylate cyclase|nr:DNA integrity scanning diadenylate cyclase DisA [Symbiobacteriaceae bacterium]
MAEERDDFWKVLRAVAPGTPLREGLESILRARTGALIVVGDNPEVMRLVDGGFRIDSEFQSASLYELAKMDGAIILSQDARRILNANATLIPDPGVPSHETGIRHRTAERVARQTGNLVIAISQRRHIISLYKGSTKYTLRDIAVILTKANQALQTLEKYKSVLDQALTNLSALELEDLVTVMDVVLVVQRTEMVRRIVAEIDRYIWELGTEGRLVSMQLEELVANVAEEGALIIRDYLAAGETRAVDAVRDLMGGWESEDLLDLAGIARILGLGTTPSALENPVSPRGYRILRKIPRLPMPVIENLVNHFGTLQRVLRASIEELDEVEGIGEVRARAIKEGLRRLREQAMLERHM